MKAIKSLMLAALAVAATFAGACSVQEVQPDQAKEKVYTLVTTLAPRAALDTRALTDPNDGTLKADWQVGEAIWVSYENQSGGYPEAKATVTEVDTDGTATIAVSLVDPKAGHVKFGYPYSLYSGQADLFTGQLGSLEDLSANFDMADGEGELVLEGDEIMLPESVKLQRQVCVWKLNFKSAGADITSAITALSITNDKGSAYEVKPSGQSAIYVALFAMENATVTFSALTASGAYSMSAKGVTLEAGKLYTSSNVVFGFEDDTVYDMTEVVAKDCTLEDGQTVVETVESHTMQLKDGDGKLVAQIKLVRNVGTKDLSGTYTVAEYAHENFTAGNGFDLGVWFGMDPGAMVIGSYYVRNGSVVIIEPGETITVSSAGADSYKFVGSSGYSFIGKIPQAGPAVDVQLKEFLSLTDYSVYGISMIGIELGTEGFYYNAPDYAAGIYAPSYPVDGKFLKLELYSTDGAVAPGTYVASASNGSVAAGEFNKGADNGFGGFNGTSLFTVKSGNATGVAVPDGKVVVSKDGDVYTITLTSSTVNATYVGKLNAGGGEEPGGIKIDGDMSDWASVKGVTEGTHTFKITSDKDNIYLYSKRSTEGRWSDIWGGAGYIYFGFDLDNNSETGDGEKADWGTGKWETLILTWPYAGSAATPAIAETTNDEWWVLPAPYTIANIAFKGVVGADGAELEFSIPRADIAAIPASEITVNAWGNKDLSRAILKCTL